MNYHTLTIDQLNEEIQKSPEENIVEAMKNVVYRIDPMIGMIMMNPIMRAMTVKEKASFHFGNTFRYLDALLSNKLMISAPAYFLSSNELEKALMALADKIKELKKDPLNKLYEEIIADKTGIEAFRHAVSKIDIKKLSVTETMSLQMSVQVIETILKNQDKSETKEKTS